MRSWPLCVALTLFLSYADGQNVTIRGDILTDSSKALDFSYIKIATKTNNRILSYFNTGKESNFTIKVPFKGEDSIVISASHVGYRTTSCTRFVKIGDSLDVTLVLPLMIDTIKDVLIKAPPIWVRGDTTFFNAESFKEGDEKKLKELLLLMPGFEIDEQGNLLYKKKRVEKVMVEGEDVFADKVKLMLNNFPVHVINTIQVLENQNSDPLKKGLVNENKVFLNIGLNKNKLKSAFGDGEAGLGTSGRYQINPVLFSLYGKLKAGYIGNWNNIGNGLDWREQDDLRNNNTLMAENWMMPTEQLQIINEMDSRRYITNGQSDNRFQFDFPISKTVKSKLEFNFFRDRQSQTIYNASNIYNGSTFIAQTDTSYIYNDPLLLAPKFSIEWKLSAKRTVNGSISFYHNGNQSSSTQYYFQQGIATSTTNDITNHWNSFEVSLSASSRPSENRYENWTAVLTQHFYPQTGSALSAAFPAIFQLPDSNYRLLSHQMENRSTIGSLTWEIINRTPKGSFTGGASIHETSSELINELHFEFPNKAITPISPTDLNQPGDYNVIEGTGHLEKLISIWNIPITLSTEDGVSVARIHEDSVIKTFATPQYNFSINGKKSVISNLTQEVKFSVDQKQAPCYKLYGILLPTSLSSFQKYSNVTLPIRSINAAYSIVYSPSHQITTGLTLGYTENFTCYAQEIGLSDFVQFSNDSLVSKRTNSYYSMLSGGLYSKKMKPICDYSLGYSASKSLIPSSGQLYPVILEMYSVNLGLNGSIGKSYHVRFSGTYVETVEALPSQLEGSVPGRVSYLHSSIIQKYFATKQVNLSLTTDWYNNNLFTNHQYSAILIDAGINYSLAKTPWSFSARLENITDQLHYHSSDISPLSQRFFSMPLIGRNVFISVRYDL